eukprot:PhF_6_TR22720/c0_g1_i1/m.32368
MGCKSTKGTRESPETLQRPTLTQLFPLGEPFHKPPSQLLPPNHGEQRRPSPSPIDPNRPRDVDDEYPTSSSSDDKEFHDANGDGNTFISASREPSAAPSLKMNTGQQTSSTENIIGALFSGSQAGNTHVVADRTVSRKGNGTVELLVYWDLHSVPIGSRSSSIPYLQDFIRHEGIGDTQHMGIEGFLFPSSPITTDQHWILRSAGISLVLCCPRRVDEIQRQIERRIRREITRCDPNNSIIVILTLGEDEGYEYHQLLVDCGSLGFTVHVVTPRPTMSTIRSLKNVRIWGNFCFPPSPMAYTRERVATPQPPPSAVTTNQQRTQQPTGTVDTPLAPSRVQPQPQPQPESINVMATTTARSDDVTSPSSPEIRQLRLSEHITEGQPLSPVPLVESSVQQSQSAEPRDTTQSRGLTVDRESLMIEDDEDGVF